MSFIFPYITKERKGKVESWGEKGEKVRDKMITTILLIIQLVQRENENIPLNYEGEKTNSTNQEHLN